jgi:TolB-like protein/tetratricopeptide (TPR) repeat protein
VKFLNELKRRNVLRVGTAYLVSSWLLIQIAETIFPLFGFGDTPARLVVIVLAIGFVPSLVLSWAFEITPEGLKKDADVDHEQSISRSGARKLDRIILVLLVLAVAYFAFDKFVLDPARDQSKIETARLEGRYDAMVESYGDRSIAVLPFKSGDESSELDYLCDGIAENLIHNLSRFPDLRVISRLSAFTFRDRFDQPLEIGRQLRVGRLLVGQLEQREDNLVVRVNLVDTRDGRELWGDRFVRPMSEILELEDNITADITTALQLELPARAAQTSGRESVDPAAYQRYLQGRFLADGSTADDIELGLTHLREATRITPSFAPAYAAIADAMIVKAFFLTSPSAEIIGEARTAAQSAIALDPDLAEAHAALASIRMFFDADWAGSEAAFQKAVSLGPSTSVAYYRYANLLTGLGRFDLAIEMAERALRIDPITISALHAAGLAKLFKGDFEGAAEVFGTAIELHPTWTWGYVKKGIAHALNGEHSEALALARRTEEMSKGWGSAFLQGWLAWVYAVTGEDDLRREVVARVKQGIKDNRIEDPFGVAVMYLANKETSLALDWAEKTVEEQSPNAMFWNVGTADHLKLAPQGFRDEPRFKALLGRLKLLEE